MLVYRAISKITGKSYVGCTTLTLGERRHKHWLNSKDSKKILNRPFYLAVQKYGWDSFEWQELCSALTKEALIDLEIHFINEFNSYHKGYNATVGGEGVLNPRKLEKYIVQFPDGTTHVVEGFKKFCRDNQLNEGNFYSTFKPRKKTYHIKGRHYTYFMKAKHCKGYVLLGKFNDYLGTEYIHSADGSGGLQAEINACLDDDIV